MIAPGFFYLRLLEFTGVHWSLLEFTADRRRQGSAVASTTLDRFFNRGSPRITADWRGLARNTEGDETGERWNGAARTKPMMASKISQPLLENLPAFRTREKRG